MVHSAVLIFLVLTIFINRLFGEMNSPLLSVINLFKLTDICFLLFWLVFDLTIVLQTGGIYLCLVEQHSS